MSDTIVARTALGAIRGLHSENLWGTKYLSFLKVPYAKPPVGNLRFKDPEPIDPWDGVLDCTVESPGCSQKMMFMDTFMGEEDCLHLSVITKNSNPKKLLPVMVFIHGGRFLCGSNTTEVYGPDYLIEKDIVLVTINYRLAALGFLNFSDPTLNVPGNAGLKDQTMALKWVKENIFFFGGDPNCITLFGESAGGASVHYHLISDLSRGLFHRAIVQSGSVFSHWALSPDRDWAGKLATALGWDGRGGEAAALETLMKADHMDIVMAQDTILTPEYRDQCVISNFVPFVPSIEAYQSSQCMIPKHPREMCRTAWSNSIPVLVGATSEEGLIFYDDIKKLIKTEIPSLKDFVLSDLNLHIDGAERRKVADKLKDFYFGKNTTEEENFNSYEKLFSDKNFLHGIARMIRSRCENTFKVPTYLYRFSYDSPNLAFIKSICCRNEPIPGVCHGDELWFLFKNSFTKGVVVKGSKDYLIIQRMVDIWTTFAATGNPNCDTTRPELWHPVAVTGPPFRCMNLSDRLEFCQLPETERMSLWDSFYNRETLT